MKTKLSYVFLLTITFLPFSILSAEASWEKIEPNNNYLTGIETTPWGILIGEFDTRVWLNPPPLNAIYFSTNLGQSWTTIGLNGRAIVDIKFYGGKIYAATYYVVENKNGLFVTDNLGRSWKQVGPGFSATKVNRDSETIYLGSENYGLWVSFDDGVTWTQKIGNGQNIKAIESFENITFATTIGKTYKTLDKGRTWEEMPFFANKGVAYFCIAEGDVIFAGSSGISGLYRSNDFGVTWTKIQSFGNYAVGDLVYYDGKIYSGRVNPILTDIYTVYESSDLGNTWTDTQLNVPASKRVIDATWTFSNPVNLFAVSLNNGLFKYEIEEKALEKFPFLEVPWKKKSPVELLDKITSFFDHEYPLLGYKNKKESDQIKTTTLNFYGNRQEQPEMYYSSHNGIDYSLPYGEEIIAPAGGTASYYYCSDCGNSIRIAHPNGYQSIYMHLQKSGLITLDKEVPAVAGDVVGKVGMTGNTNGPHLHFEVIKNGLFPDGLVDPYGWSNTKLPDLWPIFSWQDLLGLHQGTKSYYLWKDDILGTSSLIAGSGNLSLDNKTLTWNGASTNSKTVFIKNYIQPKIPETQKQLAYIANTSLLVNAYDFLGNEINEFSEPVEIKIDFTDSNLLGIIKETLKIYSWDDVIGLWKPLPTTLDLISNTATALTYHFSNFAILGEKIDLTSPFTQIDISGLKVGNWFTNYPTVELTAIDTESSPVTIFYTIGGESEWEEYKNPILVNKNGIVNFQYRSMDSTGNIEETQNYVLRINTNSAPTKMLKIKNASFKITE